MNYVEGNGAMNTQLWAVCDCNETGAGFSSDLRETFSYGEFLKHKVYSVLRFMDEYATCSFIWSLYEVIWIIYSSKIS